MAMFTMLVGLPASGKSMWAESHIGNYISSDEYRAKLFDDVNEQAHNTDLFKVMFDDTIKSLLADRDVIYDATNLNYKRRKHIVSEIQRLVLHTICKCVLFATPYEQCLINNDNRERKVPLEVIKKMYTNFTVPMYQEGWYSIEIVWWGILSTVLVRDWFERYKNFNQENKNHQLTLDAHLQKAYEKCVDYDIGLEVEWAALLHDIGKPFVKTFSNYSGKPTQDAHYFNHQNVGAYDSLFITRDYFDEDSVLYIAALIQWHMQLYFVETEKAYKKFLNIVGKEMYSDLEIIHDCDIYAH